MLQKWSSSLLLKLLIVQTMGTGRGFTSLSVSIIQLSLVTGVWPLQTHSPLVSTGASLSPWARLCLPGALVSKREKVQWVLPSPAHHHAWAVQEGKPGHGLTSSLVPLCVPEQPSLSPVWPSLPAVLPFGGHPKVSGAGIKKPAKESKH